MKDNIPLRFSPVLCRAVPCRTGVNQALNVFQDADIRIDFT
jgi:hypothetical protein